MFKIMVIGDLNKTQNVFGVYNSATDKVELYSWLDLFQDIKFDNVLYYNLELTKDKKIVYMDKFNRIPPTRDEYKKSKHIYVLNKIKNSDLVKYIVFPETKTRISHLSQLIQYCDTYNVNRLNFDIRKHPTPTIVALHSNGIPTLSSMY